MGKKNSAWKDVEMGEVLRQTSLPENEIDWGAVTKASEAIACDACPYDDSEPDGLKPGGYWVVRSPKDYFLLAALARKYPGKGELAEAAESTLDGILFKRGLIPLEPEPWVDEDFED
jgi:hypothetical protein